MAHRVLICFIIVGLMLSIGVRSSCVTKVTNLPASWSRVCLRLLFKTPGDASSRLCSQTFHKWITLR
jgi:hypothetical protein